MTQNRDPFKAGLFVLAGLVLTLVVVFILTDFSRWTTRQQRVDVSFILSDGLRGLKPGSAVTLGDQPIGVITNITDQYEGDRVTGKRAALSIPAHYHLAKNAVIKVVVPTFGADTRLNISSVGDGSPYAQGDVIPTGLAANPLAHQFVSEMGIGDQQRQQLREVITNLRDASDQARQALPKLSTKLTAIAGAIEPLVEKVGPAMEDAKAVLDNVKDITGQFRKKTPTWAKRVDDITDHASQAVTTARDIIKDKDPQIRHTLDNLDQITEHFREKTIKAVDVAVAKGSDALENLRKSSQDLRGLIVGQRPVIERALANAELTTDQLKLAAIEVRRSPWRLMYKPDAKELNTDNLYDAARSFALAASTLDAAASSLKAVAADQGNSPEQVKVVLDHLTTMYQHYEEAEKAFWEALKDRPLGQGSPKGR